MLGLVRCVERVASELWRHKRSPPAGGGAVGLAVGSLRVTTLRTFPFENAALTAGNVLCRNPFTDENV
jgi:hypothetical protein